MKVEAFVTRKARDLVRDAAESLLRESVNGLRDVKRAEVWSFDLEGVDAERELREILDETTLIVNPNVHRYTLEPERPTAGVGSRVFVRVRDRVDPKAKAVLRAICNVHGARSVKGVSRAILWTIDLDTEDVGQVERFARDAAGLDRGAGILANTHAQEVEIVVTRSPVRA